MHIQTASGETLSTLKELVDDHSESFRLHSDQIRLDLTSESPAISLATIELPVTATGINTIGSYFGVPTAFLDKIERDEAEWIINKRMERKAGELVACYTPEGVVGTFSPGQKIINPSRLVSVAEKVIDPSAIVVAYQNTLDDFSFDVVVPEGFKRGIGGDKTATVQNYLNSGKPKKGDLTHGGIRIGYDRKRNLAPWVEEFYWRLACTNGMEVRENGQKIDARQTDTVEDVLAQLEAIAEIAFSKVESRISAYYDLRNVPVNNPDRSLRSLGRDHKLPDRTIDSMLDVLPAELGVEPTMFDLINLVTNEANRRPLRYNQRRQLQVVGGAEVFNHAARCPTCKHKVG